MNNKNDYIDEREHFEEQKRLEKIVIGRKLVRPKTKRINVIAWILLYVCNSFAVAAALIYAFEIARYKWLFFLISYTVFFLLFLKKICIKAIECYQHYAKEETRRRCVCVPSCSEYSIAVRKKYNVFKALNKI